MTRLHSSYAGAADAAGFADYRPPISAIYFRSAFYDESDQPAEVLDDTSALRLTGRRLPRSIPHIFMLLR